MQTMLQKLLGAKPAPADKKREALRKRAIEMILLEEGLPKKARIRATARIYEAMRDDPR